LLDLLRSGDRKALGQLYDRYHQHLLRYCVRLLRDEQRAEDAVQNVFLKLQTGQQNIRNGQSMQSWLFTVAHNEALSDINKKKSVTADDSIVWEGDSPEDELLAKERKELIEIVLQRLHAPYREVIILREYERLSYEEIAGITGTTISSVKSRLFKARKALIEKLKPYFNERSL
jgi:RNA polymerase sigma-70 factor (ECF subfamily)